MSTKSDNDLTIEVRAPRDTEPKKFVWSKSTLVGAAADEAAKEFGYEAGTHSFRNKEKVVLPRDKALFEAGVQDFDTLTLTNTGGGV